MTQLNLFSTTRPALNANRIITLNCGVGRDSITLLCLLISGQLRTKIDGVLQVVRPSDVDAVVFADTGAEWEHTMNLVPQLKALCAAHDLRFVTLEKGDADSADMAPATSWAELEARAESGAYHYRPAIMDDFASRATVASLGKGDCTVNNKIGPIRRFISDLSEVRFGLNNRKWAPRVTKGTRQPHVTIIGIAADETSRLTSPRKKAEDALEAARARFDAQLAKNSQRSLTAKTDRSRASAKAARAKIVAKAA